jgi:NADH:ubiquinone oxidoreductase subunit 3 (subunit A)
MARMESVLPYVLAIVPTIGVGTLFYFVIKSILEGDRRERLAQARWEAANDSAANAAEGVDTPADKSADHL